MSPSTSASERGGELLVGGDRPIWPLSPSAALERLADLARRADEAGLASLSSLLRADNPETARLGAVLSLSPHLASVAERHPEWLDRLREEDAGERITAIVVELGAAVPAAATEADLSAELRHAKVEASFLIALRDLFGAADAARTTRDLSALAEACVRRAVRFCLADLYRRGKLALPDLADPERGSGLFVLGMGKLGGEELNYSSDIDLVILFDPDAEAILDPAESVDLYSRLARRLVKMIGERTKDGYVFRTDLRLRPDPSAMPLAIPVPTALVYYESAGRDWERAAMIKARAVAGDPAAAVSFAREIAPFVWRRYLDFVAIGDIRAMKTRIDRHRGFEGIAVAGHNVKLGRGGIREIEFFAQAQQLIAGGRTPGLRVRRTDEALRRLAADGWIDAAVADEMTEAYWFLRRVEHAVQMMADEQTHTLPGGGDDLLRVARLCNFETLPAFEDALLDRLRRVEARFSALFAEGAREATVSAETAALIADEADPAALHWLGTLGFTRPSDIGRIVHRWGAGRYRATRAEAAREHLARVLPSLLQAFAKGPAPDEAVAAFDRFLDGLPSGLQFFSLIASNPRLLDLLALIITAAPNLAETIARRPHVFDALLDPAFYREMPTREVLETRLEAFLADARHLEERLARLRIFASEQRFLIGVRLLSGAIEGEAAGPAYSELAETVLRSVLASVEAEFRRAHGHVAGGRLAVLGLGRLGSHELTATSDIDLMLLYDHDADAEASDGERPLPVSTYYMRLTQRLIAALSAPMAEGVLYAVDFRLRPSGNKGPLATHIDAFRKYQAEAWTWERMALTRSRAVAGDEGLRAEIALAVRDAISAHVGDPLLGFDVADMRARLDGQKPSRGPLDLKRSPGGATDIEFLAQWGLIAGLVPLDRIGEPTSHGLADVVAAHRDRPFVEGLASAERDTTRVMQLLRLGPEKAYGVGSLPQGLAERIARALDLAVPEAIEPHLRETGERVRAAFAELVPFQGAGERMPD
ncbi:bifunctional [glutamine synthetase] adenylyltransferase/[glutamine synthetase]-adenylyl-L-tyrosine phosphorylase [Aureimonas pseudogalii]|uniref:Bifunctional glutamine synthetase adenylyltransferase/adenylyl-removing enzyme n=1 Tax=Aureimonas pseudogalii TaxID=1744844 RepID=A0A7W6E887_9HYPH|nr:bifunctional [glutamine synthetase] adenylyltransferase/[glutamine synthetase]-adenylyl-L-tyrosine phosphorylase [Aureimonas pseudogalii]MBB3996550.1 glutamate-ammonia-ligase adenylyltransferase [Aureimonas pseudogalii]